jgi:hypothetical protein
VAVTPPESPCIKVLLTEAQIGLSTYKNMNEDYHNVNTVEER